MHQESEYQDITDDDIYEKNKKKKSNKKDDWCDKALEDFLETLREQPVKEMNDRNKWIMFSKRLERKGTKKRNDECRKQVFTINSLPDVNGVWVMHTGGNPEYATPIVHEITLLKLKIVIIVKHCYLMYFQYAKMMRIFEKYTWQTRPLGNIIPMNKKKTSTFSLLSSR